MGDFATSFSSNSFTQYTEKFGISQQLEKRRAHKIKAARPE
jgi:hypothetical protein